MDGIEVIVTKPVRDEGSIVVFEGTAQNDVGPVEVRFAVESRYAQDLVDALARDEEPLVMLDSWQILSLR